MPWHEMAREKHQGLRHHTMDAYTGYRAQPDWLLQGKWLEAPTADSGPHFLKKKAGQITGKANGTTCMRKRMEVAGLGYGSVSSRCWAQHI